MGRKEHKCKIPMSFNDLLRKTIGNADAKVKAEVDKDIITIKKEDGTNKNPTIDTLSKIAKALEICVDDLIRK